MQRSLHLPRTRNVPIFDYLAALPIILVIIAAAFCISIGFPDPLTRKSDHALASLQEHQRVGRKHQALHAALH